MTQNQATRTLWVVNQFDLAQDQSIEIVDFRAQSKALPRRASARLEA